MLKVLPTTVFNSFGSAKCAEIYCQSPTDFTILCAFCQMKSFEFEDFLLHFKNMHFEKDPFKSEEYNLECTPEVNVKCEMGRDEEDEEDEEAEEALNNSHMSYTEEKPTALFKELGVEQEPSEEKLIKWQSNELNDFNDIYDSQSSEDDDNGRDAEYVPDEVKSKKPQPKSREQKCRECNHVAANAGLLKIHFKKEHELPSAEEKSTEPVQCLECGEQFTTARRLDNHTVKQHTGLKCNTCDRRYRNRADLKRHEVIHSGVKDYVCDFEGCGKRFFTRRYLNSHRGLHTATKDFVCDICGYSCRIREMLRVHYRKHTGEKPYVCALCQKRFATASLLAEHRATHSTERPHVCDVCGAAYSRKKSLYHHKHLHNSEKKFKCKVCGQAFGQMAGLAGHMRKHKDGLVEY